MILNMTSVNHNKFKIVYEISFYRPLCEKLNVRRLRSDYSIFPVLKFECSLCNNMVELKEM